MKNYLDKFNQLLTRHKQPFKWILIFSFLFLFVILLANTFHEEYPDEYDSMLGGKYILEGKIPYKDWFQHHQPGAYVYAAIILAVTGISFVKFRIVLALSYFLLFFIFYFLFRKRFKSNFVDLIYLPSVIFIALIGTYFWGHMLLADTLSSLYIFFAYMYMLFCILKSNTFSRKDFIVVSLLTFLTWFTSMTYLYWIIGANVLAFYLLIKGTPKNKLRSGFLAVLIAAVPYVLFFGFFAVTGSLNDYYFANITYNQYYVYNYPRPYGSPINPLRFAIVIAYNFLNSFHAAVASVKDLNFDDPFITTFALSNIIFIIYLFFKKKWAYAFFVIYLVIYSSSRSDPNSLAERDYQAISYIYLSVINGIAGLILIYEYLNHDVKKYTDKILFTLFFIVLSLYWFASFFFAFQKLFQKMYPKYMGEAPLIYNRPEIANLLNTVVPEGEYTWIAPFDFKELFYLQRPVLTKYHWFLQHAAALPRIKDTIVKDIKDKQPTIIVFRPNFAPWGGNPYEFNYFVSDYLKENYVRLFELNQTQSEWNYKWNIGNTQNYDIDGNVYLNKQKLSQTLNSLIEKGYVNKSIK